MLKSPVESIESEDETSPTSELDSKMEQLSESRDTSPESINEFNDSEDEASSPSELHREMEELPELESQQQPEGEGAEQEAGPSKLLVEQMEVSRFNRLNGRSMSWKVPKVPWYYDPQESLRRAERDRRLRQKAIQEKKRPLHFSSKPSWINVCIRADSSTNLASTFSFSSKGFRAVQELRQE